LVGAGAPVVALRGLPITSAAQQFSLRRRHRRDAFQHVRKVPQSTEAKARALLHGPSPRLFDLGV